MSQNETGRFDTNLSSETAKILRSTGLSCSKGGYRYHYPNMGSHLHPNMVKNANFRGLRRI